MILNSIIILISIYCIYFSLRHAWWRPNINNNIPRVITYHMIQNHLNKKESKFNRLRVKPKDFEQQIKWLKNNGWTSFKLTELIENKKNLPVKSIAITIDDGYEDNFINAFPILKKYNFKATIFPVVNRFNHKWATDKDLLQESEELNNENMLSIQQINTMLESNLIEIGSHTLNHLDLTTLPNEKLKDEISTSKDELEKNHNIKCTSIVYPFGYYNENVINMVKSCGYKVAASGLKVGYEYLNNNNIFYLKRVFISGRQSFLDFKLKILKGQNR